MDTSLSKEMSRGGSSGDHTITEKYRYHRASGIQPSSRPRGRNKVSSNRQVFWLTDHPPPIPSHHSAVVSTGFVPDYSGGPATESHRLPFYPRGHLFDNSDNAIRASSYVENLPYRFTRSVQVRLHISSAVIYSCRLCAFSIRPFSWLCQSRKPPEATEPWLLPCPWYSAVFSSSFGHEILPLDFSNDVLHLFADSSSAICGEATNTHFSFCLNTADIFIVDVQYFGFVFAGAANCSKRVRGSTPQAINAGYFVTFWVDCCLLCVLIRA